MEDRLWDLTLAVGGSERLVGSDNDGESEVWRVGQEDRRGEGEWFSGEFC